MKVIFFADIVGRVGRIAVARALPQIREENHPDIVIANAENASGGFGVRPEEIAEMRRAGVDIFTLGNHAWDRRELAAYSDKVSSKVIRPINFPPGNPGRGMLIESLADGTRLAVVNVMGRVMMRENIDCPFRAADKVLSEDLRDEKCIIVDFHAEATSEKVAFGRYLDGRVSAVVGTHTHIQTADERILAGGTAYITDVGMCGPRESVLGMDPGPTIEKFITGFGKAFDVAKGVAQVNAVLLEIDPVSGRSLSISRLQRVAP